jgi:hypothetical protein
LAYEANVLSLTVDRPETPTRIKMSIGGRPVYDPRLVTLRVRNSGNTPILSSDFDGPIEVAFGTSVDLLDVAVDDSEPGHLTPIVNILTRAVRIDPLLLNPGDSFLLTILSDGATEPQVLARIAGVPNPTREPPQLERRRLRRRRELRTILAMLGFVLVGYVVLVVATFSLSKRPASLKPGDGRDPAVSGCSRTGQKVPGTAVALAGHGLRFGTLTLQRSTACGTAWARVSGLGSEEKLRLVLIANRPADHATSSYAQFGDFNYEGVYGDELFDNRACVRAIAVVEHRGALLARAQTPCR